MKKLAYITTALILLASVYACEKERIVESTEYIERIEVVELPGDTIYQTDTVFNGDTISLTVTDTITDTITDTVTNTITDTITNTVTNTITDTVTIRDTLVMRDTVVVTNFIHDTIRLIDTIQTVLCGPNKHLAMAAMQFNTDQLVLDLIKQNFGIDGGWVLYMSNFQTQITELSPGSYVLVGVIDYWTTAWDQYYPLEFSWKLTHTGGDPADPLNWRMDDPAAGAAPYHPGLRLKNSAAPSVGSGN